jgi:Verrucomicrobium spinosum paralogous family TIGR02598
MTTTQNTLPFDDCGHFRTRVVRKPLRARQHGFSLIEVTIALGIVGFCLSVLLGLLGSGLSLARSASDRTVSAQIAQRLIGMAQQTDWSQKASLESGYFYFDGDGQPLESSAQDSVFSACVLIDEGTRIPGSSAGGLNDRLAKVRVRVVRDPSRQLKGSPAEELRNQALEAQSSEFIAFLADNGS